MKFLTFCTVNKVQQSMFNCLNVVITEKLVALATIKSAIINIYKNYARPRNASHLGNLKISIGRALVKGYLILTHT